MSCFRPMAVYRDRHGAIKIGLGGSHAVQGMMLPCGRCIGCKLARAHAWKVRIVHEASLYESNWFATLTYADEKLVSWSLRYRDFQLFMKRLRKDHRGHVGGPDGKYRIRFFCAGEYGSKRKRPHFHAVLFNVKFGDAVRWTNDSWYSAELERLWTHGRCQLDRLTPASAAYVAGYVNKKVYGAAAVAAYELVNEETGEVVGVRVPEFVRMSLRPGIGSFFFDRYSRDLFPLDAAVVDGQRSKVPRYYWERFRKEGDPVVVEELEHRRYLRAMENREEGTAERLAVREGVAEARVAFKGERADL